MEAFLQPCFSLIAFVMSQLNIWVIIKVLRRPLHHGQVGTSASSSTAQSVCLCSGLFSTLQEPLCGEILIVSPCAQSPQARSTGSPLFLPHRLLGSPTSCIVPSITSGDFDLCLPDSVGPPCPAYVLSHCPVVRKPSPGRVVVMMRCIS